jgi:cytochrome c551/c552
MRDIQPPAAIVLTALQSLYTIAAQVHTSIFRRIFTGGALLVSLATVYLQGQNAAELHTAVVTRYCVSCHNERTRTGGLSLESLEIANAGERPEIWEKVVQKLHGNLMPPGGRPRPDDAAQKSQPG